MKYFLENEVFIETTISIKAQFSQKKVTLVSIKIIKI